jgi:hypothetical protein
VSIRYEQSTEKPRPFHAIRCEDCRVILFNKTEAVRRHRGHELHYIDKDGNQDD